MAWIFVDRYIAFYIAVCQSAKTQQIKEHGRKHCEKTLAAVFKNLVAWRFSACRRCRQRPFAVFSEGLLIRNQTRRIRRKQWRASAHPRVDGCGFIIGKMVTLSLGAPPHGWMWELTGTGKCAGGVRRLISRPRMIQTTFRARRCSLQRTSISFTCSVGAAQCQEATPAMAPMMVATLGSTGEVAPASLFT